MALDLRPFMQRTPFVLQGNASLARAYRLFRTMGLHHLYVGPPKPQVIGLLTRKVILAAPPRGFPSLYQTSFMAAWPAIRGEPLRQFEMPHGATCMM